MSRGLYDKQSPQARTRNGPRNSRQFQLKSNFQGFVHIVRSLPDEPYGNLKALMESNFDRIERELKG